MSRQNTITFISNVDKSFEFRKSCYSCHSQKELLDMLKEQGMAFTPDEFTDTIKNLLVKCRRYDQADRVKEVRAWFSLFW